MSTIVVGKDGTIRMVHDDAWTDALARCGRVDRPRRASNVEPCDVHPQGWIVDLTPVGGPKGGPRAIKAEHDASCCWTTRAAALKAEVAWLEYHNIPIPGRS